MRPRTTDEVFSDELVTLLLLAELQRAGAGEVDRLRLQKLCFLLAHKWFVERRKGLNYRFFRYRYGPFTPELYQTEVDLAVARLIEPRGAWTFVITREGLELANELREELTKIAPEHREFLADIEWVAQKYGTLSTPDLLEQVYALGVAPLGWREVWPLRDVPTGLDLTRPLEDAEVSVELEIPIGWLETLAFLINERAEDPIPMPHGV